ncbi:MAG: hypothetical protein H0T73_16000 [Ardenticatenales bacterium]|nr:hypothetical protein [Ardenticatenales bacterium]
MSTRARVGWLFLLLLVLASLASNAYLIYTALQLQNQLAATSLTAGLALDNAANQLETVRTQEFTLTVPIDEEIPVNATIPFDETFNIPINLTVPINTNVKVPLQLGMLGTFNLDIPIRTDVPIDITVPIHIKRNVPINTVVPIKLDVPITLTLKGTPMASQLEEWREIILELRKELP